MSRQCQKSRVIFPRRRLCADLPSEVRNVTQPDKAERNRAKGAVVKVKLVPKTEEQQTRLRKHNV